MKRLLKEGLLPTEANDYQPHAMRGAGVFGLLLLVLITFAAANIQSLVWLRSDWMISTILPAIIVTDTNEERMSRAREPLARNDVLDRAATLKAEHMAAHGYFAHFSPDGVSPWYWFDEAGYSFVHAGENLAVYFTDSSAVVDAWMNSPLHRANILDYNYREIGIGIAPGEYDGYETVYVVQLFGTPAANDTVSAAASVSDESANETAVATAAVATSAPQVAGISDVMAAELEETDSVVYSSHLSTTTDKTPAVATTAGTTVGSSDEPPRLIAALTKPGVLLQAVYLVVAGFVAFALVCSLLAHMRRRRPMQIVYGVALLILMAVLVHVHIAVSTGVLIA